MRLALESTNDLGERMVAESAFLINKEFRKFMYLNAKRILELKWEGAMD